VGAGWGGGGEGGAGPESLIVRRREEESVLGLVRNRGERRISFMFDYSLVSCKIRRKIPFSICMSVCWHAARSSGLPNGKHDL